MRLRAYVGPALLILLVGAGAGYIIYDEVTESPSACDETRQRVDAWETVLNVPDNLAGMEPEQALDVLERIEKDNPQGYAEWQYELDALGSCPSNETYGDRPRP